MYGDEEEGTSIPNVLEGEEFSLMTFVNGDLAVPFRSSTSAHHNVH